MLYNVVQFMTAKPQLETLLRLGMVEVDRNITEV